MGANFFRRSCSTNPTQPAANPGSFRVLREERVGNHWVSMLHYPGCTNYEGHKVILSRGQAPSARRRFDPHFEQGGDVVARFEPTPQGFEMALRCARNL